MKTTKIVALLLACALLLGGCSLVSVDPDKVAEQVVARVNSTEIYKYEISENEILSNVQYQAYIGQQMGISYSQEDIDQMILDARESALQDRVEAEVMLQKAKELDIALTEEEKTQNMQDAKDQLDYISESFVNQVEQEIADEQAAAQAETDTELTLGDDTATDETADTADSADTTADDTADEPEETEEPTDPAVLAEAQTRYEKYLEENKITVDSIYNNLCRQDIVAKVKDYMVSFAVVTDEEVRTWYDQTLALQQEEMDADASVFKQKIAGKNIYTYVPQRIVAVRDIFIAFDDELSESLKTAYDEGEAGVYDELLNVAINDSSDLIAEAANIKERLDSGETAEDIVEELSEQMDNIFDNTPDYGYIVDPRTTDYSENYVKAATSLETVGETSAPFVDYEGIHVLALMKVYEQGVIPFEDIADSIKAALLPGEQEDMYNQTLEQWMDEAKITYYYKRLNSNNDL